MKIIQENLIEMFLLIGMILLSIGFFIWSTMIGFIVTGCLFIVLAFITFRFGNEGGD